MKTDYHIHTKRCKHATGEIDAYVEQAIAEGFDEIAFTDHIPLPENFDIAHRMTFSELEDYANDIERLKTRFPEIKIHRGIEADFYDGFEPSLEKTIREFDFEIVIMSVHFIKGWPKNNWAFSYYFPDRTISEIYSDYLQAMMRGIKTGLFDIVGHLDLIKSPDQPLLKHNEAELRQLLGLVSETGMALEINTSGLRKEIAETYPAADIFPLLQEYGLAITMGSDAHAPEQVGLKFAETGEKLAGFPGLNKVLFDKNKIVTSVTE